jgi:trimeric autotransporter adhesin
MGYLGYKPADKPLTSADITDSIITSAKIVDGTIVNADINASAAIVASKLSGIVSGILQVKKTLITSTISTTVTNTYVDVSGFSVTITPTSSTSQILLLGLINSSHISDTGQRMRFRLLRGSTDITAPDSPGSRQTGFFTPEYDTDDYECTTGSLTWWDNPATTSATTYKLQVTTNNSGSQVAYINRSRTDSDNIDHVRTVSSIVAIEVSTSVL